MPVPQIGRRIVIMNRGLYTATIYPSTNTGFDAGSPDNPIYVAPFTIVICYAASTQFWSTSKGFYAASVSTALDSLTVENIAKAVNAAHALKSEGTRTTGIDVANSVTYPASLVFSQSPSLTTPYLDQPKISVGTHLIPNSSAPDGLTINSVNYTIIYTKTGSSGLYYKTGAGGAEIQLGATTVVYGSPSASAVGDTASDGISASVSRTDHKHARESFGAPSALSYGGSSSNGTALTISRSDHIHQLPSLPANVGSLIISSTSYTGNLTISAGTGVTVTASGSTITIANSGVTSLTAGSGITVSASSGAVTISQGLQGTGSTSSGYNSVVSGGYYNTASDQYSTVSGGAEALADSYGKYAYASGKFAYNGDAQLGRYILRGATTNNGVYVRLSAANQNLTTDTADYLSAANQYVVLSRNYSAYSFQIFITAIAQGSQYASGYGDGHSWQNSSSTGANIPVGYWEYTGLIARGAGDNTTLLHSKRIGPYWHETAGYNDTAGTLEQDYGSGRAEVLIRAGPKNCLDIAVKGPGATNVRWVAVVHTAEVYYP